LTSKLVAGGEELPGFDFNAALVAFREARQALNKCPDALFTPTR